MPEIDRWCILMEAMRMRSILLCAILAPGFAASAQVSQAPSAFAGLATPAPEPRPAKFEAIKDSTPLPGKNPFVRYFTTDEFGRTIVFYVAEPPVVEGDAAKRFPVVMYVQGSGSQSVFSRVMQGENVLAAASGGQGVIRQVARNDVIVVIAEKPGVRFMECPRQPGGAEEGSLEFLEQHTLSRWSAAVSAALQATLTLPRADSAKVLVVGHSEGGLVACKVAAENAAVTHVATLAGGGPTQLFDLIELARTGVMCGNGGRDPEGCVRDLLAQWDEVLKSPDSTEALFLGHPHRRWTSFLATSPIDELKKTRAKIFIGQGTEDKSVYPPGADVLYASLRALGRDVNYSRVKGDHGFMTAGDDGKVSTQGWQAMHERVLVWFLGHPLSNSASQQPRP